MTEQKRLPLYRMVPSDNIFNIYYDIGRALPFRPLPPRLSRHRPPQVPHRHLRPRLLLARPQGLQELHGSQDQHRLLDRQNRPEPARDQDTWRQLEAKGWSVIIVWECELKKQRLQETVETTASAIRKNGEILRSAQEDRKKAREEYRKARREQKARESALREEIRQNVRHH